jgi:hypothetical protein
LVFASQRRSSLSVLSPNRDGDGQSKRNKLLLSYHSSEKLYPMKPILNKRLETSVFEIVRTVGLTLPGVEATTKYDGSPMLTIDGIFMAGLAMHRSVEPDTLVIRAEIEDRDRLVEDAPDTYYLTDYYRKYPLVLVRLSKVDTDALRDLLSVSWRMTMAKARR